MPTGDSAAATGTISSPRMPQLESRNGPKFNPYEWRLYPQCGLQTSYSLLPCRLEKQTLAPKAFINSGRGPLLRRGPPQ